jgi:hypothetical protein
VHNSIQVGQNAFPNHSVIPHFSPAFMAFLTSSKDSSFA